MEEGQATTSQSKGINNSIRGAALCIGLKPETIAKFLPLMRSFESNDMAQPTYETLSDECYRLKQMINSLHVEKEYLLKRIEELAHTVTKQHEEAVKLQQDVSKAQGKVA